jgi:hypothetical protein
MCDQTKYHRVPGSVLVIHRPTMRWLRKRLASDVNCLKLRVETDGSITNHETGARLDREAVCRELDHLLSEAESDYYWWTRNSDGSYSLQVQYY